MLDVRACVSMSSGRGYWGILAESLLSPKFSVIWSSCHHDTYVAIYIYNESHMIVHALRTDTERSETRASC